MDAIEKLRAKGMHDVAAEFMRNRNELIVARRSLLVSHQINEEYRTKLEARENGDAAPIEAQGESTRLIERCAELAQALEAATTQCGELQDRLAQSNRSLTLAMRTAQEEAGARAQAEHEKAHLSSELESLRATLQGMREHAQTEGGAHDYVLGDHAEAVTPKTNEDAPGGSDEAARLTIEALELRIEAQRQALEVSSILHSENEALKRQLEELETRYSALVTQGAQTQAEQDEKAEQIRRLEDEKIALAQQAQMSVKAMRTLQEDVEACQRALSDARHEGAQGLARNAELNEKVRELSAQIAALQAHPSPDPFSDIDARRDESRSAAPVLPIQDDLHERECARRQILGPLLEETVMKGRLPDEAQMKEIATWMTDTAGQRALDRLVEIEKGRMTRRILAALAADE